MDEKSVGLISAQCASPWKVYVDGAANQRGSGVGLVLVSFEKITIEKSLRLGFLATNNEAKFETLLIGMADQDYGNGWKDSGNVFRFKTSRRPSKRGIGSTRYKNAGIFEPS